MKSENIKKENSSENEHETIISAFSKSLRDRFNKKTKDYTKYEKRMYANRLHFQTETEANDFMYSYFIQKKEFTDKNPNKSNKNTMFE